MKPSSFHIYDASAGSGKTFTIVKEYLKLLFSSTRKEPYAHILAITFTNKAVGEMKQRILESLKSFADDDILENPIVMFNMIVEELNIKPHILHQKSKHLLESIVHNYAAFDISTIDKFNQKLIRTFAYDLKLPLNFEVELDTDAVLSKAVDNLIAKAGDEKAITKALVDFAIEKADDDRSWDVAFDFNQIAKLLTNENDFNKIALLKNKTLTDFKALKASLIEKITLLEDAIISKSNEVLELIETCGLEFNDFSGSYFPKHFEKLIALNFNLSFDSKWQEDIENKTLYPKRVTLDIASIIDEIQPQLASAFYQTRDLVFNHKLLNAIYKNSTPLSVLNAISTEVYNLKEEQNLLLISEFNSIVSSHIKTQPAPFIYERIGEKFKHYFIDEFQDTSIMQWQNLIPLIDNALSSENASATIVGDAKQAIYRWRGGKAEQFIELSNCKNPFQTEKHLHQLKENYRSFEAIVSFNNSFFNHLSTFVFSGSLYKQLYQQSFQNQILKNTGYVNINFLETKDEDKDELYARQTLVTIENCLQKGFQQKDICVLVRKKKEGIAIADYLNTNSTINILSSETLLISHSPEIVFIINLFHLIKDPNNKEAKVSTLSYLAEHKFNIEDKHQFFDSFIHLELPSFFKAFERFDIYFNYNQVLQLSLYEAAELIIHSFNLVETSNAYVQYFLDFVLDYSLKQQSSLLGFLEHFEKKKETLSIVSPDAIEAVQIMTIHKAKGLEFPVVIFPFADLDIYRENNPKTWFPLTPEDFNGFELALINFNKDIENFNESGTRIYSEHQAELELDNINLLYVALTRAIEQLYIISAVEFNSKGVLKENRKQYSGLFISYLKSIEKWKDDQLIYSFGNSTKTSELKKEAKESIEQSQFITTPKRDLNISIITNSGYLWDTAQHEAIERGNLIHLIMSFIKTSTDIDFTFSHLLTTGIINPIQMEELKPTVQLITGHPDLCHYFNSEDIIYNERDIISENGLTIRPDRLVINEKKEVTIIDYKTGKFQESHKQQLQNYKQIIQKMDLIVSKLILVYINTEIDVKEV